MIEIVDRITGELLDTDSVPGLAQVAALHNQRLEQVSARLDEILVRDAGTSGGAQGPVVWHLLTPLESERTWRELAQWVGWLRGRYPLAHQLPLCWWRHPELVEELTALWLAWRDAYVEKGAPLTAGADWHARWLPDFRRRIGAGGWNLACEVDHRPLVETLYDTRSVDNPTEFARWIDPAPPDDDLTEGNVGVQRARLEALVASGEATRLGDLPDSPVAYDGRYWVPDDEGWSAVDSKEAIAFLDDAQRRLRLATQAVRESEQP